MPNYNPSPSTRWQPGQSGNPNKKLPPEVKQVRRMTHADIAEVGSLAITASVTELQDIVKNPGGHSAIKLAFATCLLKAIQNGDSQALNTILNRIVGGVRTEIAIASPRETITVMAELSDEDIEARYRKLAARAIGDV